MILSFCNKKKKKNEGKQLNGYLGKAFSFYCQYTFRYLLLKFESKVSLADNQIFCFVPLFMFKDDKIEFLKVNGCAFA